MIYYENLYGQYAYHSKTLWDLSSPKQAVAFLSNISNLSKIEEVTQKALFFSNENEEMINIYKADLKDPETYSHVYSFKKKNLITYSLLHGELYEVSKHKIKKINLRAARVFEVWKTDSRNEILSAQMTRVERPLGERIAHAKLHFRTAKALNQVTFSTGVIHQLIVHFKE